MLVLDHAQSQTINGVRSPSYTNTQRVNDQLKTRKELMGGCFTTSKRALFRQF
jgi:hypothetical protein